jgi:hypothetical protein
MAHDDEGLKGLYNIRIIKSYLEYIEKMFSHLSLSRCTNA